MLHAIAETARSPTGTRYAVVTTIDGSRQVEDAVLRGSTQEEERRVAQWTENMPVFETLRDLLSPLRVADTRAHVGALGFPTDGVIIRTFEGSPIRHRGVQVGGIFPGEQKTEPEFTAEDEEVLVPFAAQATATSAAPPCQGAELQAGGLRLSAPPPPG